MALAVELSAYSAIIGEGRDFSGTLYDVEGNLVAQGEYDLPAHAGTAQFTVWSILSSIDRADMLPGDVYIMNEPYLGGTHNNDVRLVRPIFWGQTIVAFVANTGHWTDVGGTVPGSLYIEATDAYQEGMRIPPMRLVRDGQLDDSIVGLMLANMRVASERRGDLNAQLAACLAGERRISELLEKYGPHIIAAAMSETQDYAERLLRAHIAALPDGSWFWEDQIDRDMGGGTFNFVRLRMTIAGDDATFDFSETDPVVPISINCTYSGMVSCLSISVKALFPDVPLNHGLFRAMTIIAQPDTLVTARHPAPVSGLAATAFERVICCVLGIFSYVAPERTIAGSSNLINITFGGETADGTEFVTYLWTEGGLGARATRDGCHALLAHYAASTMNIPIEVQERAVPMLWESYGLRTDAVGAGRYQGGIGCERILRMTTSRAVLSAIGDRSITKPWGLFGGRASPVQGIARLQSDGGREELGVHFANLAVRGDERFHYYSTGGGGYGPPAERELSAIVSDIEDGYITPDFAAAHYGLVVVIVDAEALDLYVDLEASHALRESHFGAASRVVPGEASPLV
jgi:N-methylhydantoinase B